MFCNIAQSSSQRAVEFLNKFVDKITSKNTRVAMEEFFKIIIERGEEQNFSLNNFPVILHPYIINLLTLNDFQSIKKAWTSQE